MKTKFILGALWTAALAVNAQNTNPWPSSGDVGIGTTSPAYRLDVVTTSANNGIRITKAAGSNGAGGLYLDNKTTRGRLWSILSLGNGDAPGSGKLAIWDNKSNNCRFIIDTLGGVGIGTTSTDLIRLHTVFNTVPTSNDQYGTKSEITQGASVGAGSYLDFIGVEGDAATNYSGQSIMKGVQGKAQYGQRNYGGYFYAAGGATGTGLPNYGVYAEAAAGNDISYGIYATASGGANTNWAGFFNGDVSCVSLTQTSDQRLKDNVKLLTNSMDKIKQLKPSSYVFKTEEFKAMNLPKGNQLGIIAQELEKVFPELVTEVAGRTRKDGSVEIKPYKTVNYIGLIPVLIAGIQEQQKQIENYAEANSALKTRLEDQQKQIEDLNQKMAVTTGINSISNMDGGFQMSQNEPNPFTHETVVKYTLPQSVSNAFMAVYDLTGKQVTTFPITQKGSSSLTITSEKLAAGIYIYSIVADGRVIDSKRMIVSEK